MVNEKEDSLVQKDLSMHEKCLRGHSVCFTFTRLLR